MLTISQELAEAMLAHALEEEPIEACGVLSGRAGTPERIIPMVNDLDSELAYVFDPQQQLAVWQGMEDRGEQPVAIYHSHTHHEAYPSRRDIAGAVYPEASYVIVSTLSSPPSVRSFRIVAGEVEEEPVVVAP